MTILIVDDNAAMRGMIRSMFDGRRYRMFESPDGDAALNDYERIHPDVVLMDVQLGGTNGITATRRLCSEHPEARVVMVTNHTDRWTRQAAQAAGAVAFVPKDELMSVPNIVRSLGTHSPRH